MTRVEALREVDKRLTPWIRQLNGHQLQKGAEWYPDAWIYSELVTALSKEQNPLVSAERVAAATAILSPLQPWTVNQRMALELARDRYTAPKTFHKWWMKAQAALWTQRPQLEKLASGPKVNPFWRAICGDENAVVVDRWILRLAYPDDRGYPARIRRIEKVITKRAREIGIAPRDLQAALWLSVRGE